jgi:phosphatidylserine decarboxylase
LVRRQGRFGALGWCDLMSSADSLVGSIRKRLVPIRPEGVPFIAILVFVALFFGWFWQPILWIGLFLAVWCAYFFRDPPRVIPVEDGVVVSPADGRVSLVSLEVAPKELKLGEQMRRRVSISLGALDCHVNRAPIGGTVAKTVYRPGKLVSVEFDKESDRYERNSLLLQSDFGPVAIVQIAGLIARRIVCLTAEGSDVATGERIGLIRFGSQVDLYLPASAALLVAEGQTTIAGETIIARFGAAAAGSSRRVRID